MKLNSRGLSSEETSTRPAGADTHVVDKELVACFDVLKLQKSVLHVSTLRTLTWDQGASNLSTRTRISSGISLIFGITASSSTSIRSVCKWAGQISSRISLDCLAQPTIYSSPSQELQQRAFLTGRKKMGIKVLLFMSAKKGRYAVAPRTYRTTWLVHLFQPSLYMQPLPYEHHFRSKYAINMLA